MCEAFKKKEVELYKQGIDEFRNFGLNFNWKV